MKTITTVIAASALALVMVLISGCATSQHSGSHAQKPAFLFTVVSKHGAITKNSQGQYHLNLKDEHIEKIIMFSDRPYRIVKMITPKQLKALWPQGADSLQKDPPNAVVVINNKPQAVVLTGVSVKSHSITFSLAQDGEWPITVAKGKAQVFIDSVQWFCHGPVNDVFHKTNFC